MKPNFLGKDELGDRGAAILLGIGVIIVVGVAFFVLQKIWIKDDKVDVSQTDESPSIEESNIENVKLGSFTSVTNGQSLILKEYFSEIFRLFSSGTKEEIYAKVSKDFLQKYGYDSNMLYNKLKNKNIIGKAFESKEYSYIKNPRFGNIYSLEISSVDGSVLDRIIILEEKPRSYKLSFESYLGLKEQDINVVREGVKLSITSVEEYRDRVYFDIVIQNLNEDSVILNYGSQANEAIYAELANGSKVYNILNFFSSKEIELKSNQSVTAKVEFLASDLQTANITKIGIVNVYNSQSETTSNFEYQVY